MRTGWAVVPVLSFFTIVGDKMSVGVVFAYLQGKKVQ